MVSPKNTVFYAVASKGYTLKVLIDVLSGVVSRTTVFLSEDGIRIRKMNQNKMILFDCFLEREKFRSYHCKKSKRISLNLVHLQRIIKNVKKKDSMTLFIAKKGPDDPENSEKLGLIIRPEGSSSKQSRTETNFIVVKDESDPSKNTTPSLPEYHQDGEENIPVYEYPVVIDSSDFQKIKKLTSIGKTILVNIQSHNYISFYCDSGDIYSSMLEYGMKMEESDSESDEDDESDDEDSSPKGWYEASFYTSIFNLLIKLPGLCSQIQFYSPKIPGYPLKLKMNAGTGQSILGDIQIYIKDIDQIKAEEDYSQSQEDIGL